MTPQLLVRMAQRYGTPLYVYDLGEVRARMQQLSAALPPGAELLYSLKANPLPSLLGPLRTLRAEVSSTGELEAAAEAGFDLRRALLTGPGKTDAVLDMAMSKGVGTVSVESEVDLHRVKNAARRAGAEVDILVRVRPEADRRARISMGANTWFGAPMRELLEWLPTTLEQPCRLVGVHVYAGSQQPADALAAAAEVALRAAEQLEDRLGMELDIVDVGGGFPWPYATGGHGPNPVLPHGSGSRRLWFEAGRFLTASSGTFVSRVLDVRHAADVPTVVMDGGIQALGGMSGLGRVLRPALEPTLLETNAEDAVMSLVGPLCTPLDVLGRRCTMPIPSVGDVVAVPNVGAYGLTASLVGFLSRIPPAEVVLDGGRVVSASRLGLLRTPCDEGGDDEYAGIH